MTFVFRCVKAYKKMIFNLSASENPFFLLYCKFFYKPKTGSVAEFLDQYSKKNEAVTFLQIGANDGFIHDPLHLFIKRDNWEGVMLEPQIDVYNNFLAKLHRKRPGIISLNAALDKSDGHRPLYRLAISNERWATGLSSFDKKQLLDKLTDARFLRHVHRQGIVLPENRDEVVIADVIDTISPDTLFEKYNIGNAKLLAIDTEGFDFEIIKMLDLDRISPEIILYEEVNFDGKTVHDCREYLKNHGYFCKTIKKDVIAVKQKPNEDQH
jgi:FkbM family methyltransferase